MKQVVEDITAYWVILFEKEKAKIENSFVLDKKYNGKYKSIIGESKSVKKLFDKLELIENSESPVLIEGETGTGKELIASAIHYNSARRDKPFVIQNCSAFSDTILSSELFGHEKGSFTGAVIKKKGLFEIADGGTLFLDEIGDLSIDVQGKLLRVLENGAFYRVGGTEERAVDVRIITATNKDMPKMVKEGLFRQDLFYRINTHRINTPPLRERIDDIMPLLFYFLEYYTDKAGIGKKELSSDLIKMLKRHNWPGNIRELKNTVESLITMSGKSETIELDHLPIGIVQQDYLKMSVRDHEGDKKLSSILKSVEKDVTEEVLQEASWNKTVAAKELGISRVTLNRNIEKYNISKKDF
jgi:two-component system response regulator HupR/HoxA